MPGTENQEGAHTRANKIIHKPRECQEVSKKADPELARIACITSEDSVDVIILSSQNSPLSSTRGSSASKQSVRNSYLIQPCKDSIEPFCFLACTECTEFCNGINKPLGECDVLVLFSFDRSKSSARRYFSAGRANQWSHQHHPSIVLPMVI